MFHPPPSRPQQPLLDGLITNDRCAKIRNLPDSKIATQSSGWKSTLKRSLSCNEPPSPNPTIEPSLEQDTEGRPERKDHAIPSWSSSLDECVTTADAAHQDVFDQLRAMTQPRPRQQLPPQPQMQYSLARPDSQDVSVSELDSHASLHSLRSVSELEAESEPTWLAAAVEVKPRVRHNPLLDSSTVIPITPFSEIDGCQGDSIAGDYRRNRPETTPTRPAQPSPKSMGGGALSFLGRLKAHNSFQPNSTTPKTTPLPISQVSDEKKGKDSAKEVVVAPVPCSEPRGSTYYFTQSKSPVSVRKTSRKTSVRRPSPLSNLLEPENKKEELALDLSPLMSAKTTLRNSEADCQPDDQPREEIVLAPTRTQQSSLDTETEAIFNSEFQKHSQPALNLSPKDIQSRVPSAPLIALLYFTLELPRASTHHRGTYLRHFAHPMRLPLSTNRQIHASIAHLRGYLTQQPARFLSHFCTTMSGIATPPTHSESSGRGWQLLVNFPGLFSGGTGGSVAEKIWGPELRWAWVDASDERFAEAVVSVLRELAVGRVTKGMGGVADITCVVRQVVDGRRGYGLLMDMRRTVRVEPQRRVGRRASSGNRISIN